jgi:NitT/TauT family transport system ATP-binding protein
MSNDIILHVDHVGQAFGDNRVLYDVDLTVVRGQFVGLVGPSGCGKSTLLRAILGTDPPSEGSVLVDGKEVTGPTKEVGVVYQSYDLYDFLTAEQNVAIGPIWTGLTIPQRILHPIRTWRFKRHIRHKARRLLEKVKLGHAMDKYPNQLSGGMKQRVAIAQSVIMEHKLLLLDEPFGALDEATREELQHMLLVLYAENMQALQDGKKPPHTVVLVTHELNEAFYCCDRVIGLSRNWMDMVDGKQVYGKDVGATKVYDKAAPTFRPGDPKNFERFAGLIADLRKIVFGDKIQDRFEAVSFWDDLQNGVGTGVALDWSERNVIPEDADAT